VKSWIRHFLPFGLVKASQVASELQGIGLGKQRAWRLAIDPGITRRLQRLNFDLLPGGALAAPECVVDLGANVGDWTADLLVLCQPARVVCIEPDPRLAPKLRERFAGRQDIEICETAVGSASGLASFNLMHNPLLNSFRKLTGDIAKFYSEPVQAQDTVMVQVHPLDSLLPSSGRITILKIDAQGFEREVLAGAEQTLRRTDYVIMEINFQPHYEGEAGFFELDGLMQKHGFALGNYSKPKGGRRQALYADAVYLRKES
jgi:FkbM family methyltransferase